MACRTLPVKGKRQRLPAGLRTQFFLTHVVRPAAAALADAAAEDQHVDQTTVVHIEVIPVVKTRTDDDHGTTVGLIGVFRKLAGDTHDLRAWNAGDLLRPCRGISLHVVIAGGAVFITQTAFQAVVRHGQVIDGGDQRGSPVGQLQAFHRQLVHQHVFQLNLVEVLGTFAAKVREAHISNLVLATQHAQTQFRLFTGRAVTLLKVPLALLAPAEADRAVWRHQLTVAVIGDGFPLWVIFLAQRVHQIGGAQRTACGVVAVTLFEHHQHRHVSVATDVVGEVLAWFIQVELAQHDVAHRHRHRGIGPLFRCQPQIAQLGDFGVVRGHRHGFGAFVTHLGKEVRVRRTGLRHV